MSRLEALMVEGSTFNKVKVLTDADVLGLADRVRSDCKKYLRDVFDRSGWKIMRRSVGVRMIGRAYKVIPRSDRRSKDLGKTLHDNLNKVFEERFGWKVRGGVFTYTQGMYGVLTSNIFLPIGDYKYCYSPLVVDLWDDRMVLGSMDLSELDSWIADKYVDRGLHATLMGSMKSVEVAWNCKAYYLIHGTVWERMGMYG